MYWIVLILSIIAASVSAAIFTVRKFWLEQEMDRFLSKFFLYKAYLKKADRDAFNRVEYLMGADLFQSFKVMIFSFWRWELKAFATDKKIYKQIETFNLTTKP